MENQKEKNGLKPGTLVAVIITAAVVVASFALLTRKESAPETTPVATAEAPKAEAAKTEVAAAPKPAPKAEGGAEKLQWLDQPLPVAATPFTDATGATKTLADFQGKVLVVNFWATWCAPCVKEMPTLDALQAALGGDKFAVIAINQDREGAKVAAPFIATNEWRNIALYTEPGAKFAKDAAIRGLPTSLIVDSKGREVARLEGTIAWNGADVQAKLKELMDAK